MVPRPSPVDLGRRQNRHEKEYRTFMQVQNGCPVERLEVKTYRVPTDAPESDGTLQWDHTDVVLVTVEGGGNTGVGWTYASTATGDLILELLSEAVVGRSLFAIEAAWAEMHRRLRNVGVRGAGSMAVAAVDTALWDLKARFLGVPLVDLFGRVRDVVELYGSGGFTSYTDERLTEQMAYYAIAGFKSVKMKVGRDASADLRRVRVARAAIGDSTQLFVDANGAYSRKQALDLAQQFAAIAAVTWFEEPLSSRDLAGLRLLRDRGPAGMDISAGEYGDTLGYFRAMLEADSLDCLQADVTRCGGYTGFIKVAALCDAYEMPLSAHCAPQLHAHIGCATSRLRHVEYFHDHQRVESLLFDGVLPAVRGSLQPDRTRGGHGMVLKHPAAENNRYR